MSLRALRLALPVAIIAARILVKGHDEMQSTIDREVTLACVARIARVEARPSEQILREKKLRLRAAQMRAQAKHFIDLVLGEHSGIRIPRRHRARELTWLGRIEGDDAVVCP